MADLRPRSDPGEAPAAVVGVRGAADLASLVERAREGERGAFAELFEARVGVVHRYVGAILHDPDRTQDAVAETFVAAWRSLPRLRQADRFDGWLLRIAHRRAIDELRRTRPLIPLDAAPEIADDRPDASPSAATEAAADADLVRGALAGLPAPQREVVTLRYLHDLSYGQIAQQVGRTNQAVRQLHQRAMARLRRQLEAPLV